MIENRLSIWIKEMLDEQKSVRNAKILKFKVQEIYKLVTSKSQIKIVPVRFGRYTLLLKLSGF